MYVGVAYTNVCLCRQKILFLDVECSILIDNASCEHMKKQNLSISREKDEEKEEEERGKKVRAKTLEVYQLN